MNEEEIVPPVEQRLAQTRHEPVADIWFAHGPWRLPSGPLRRRRFARLSLPRLPIDNLCEDVLRLADPVIALEIWKRRWAAFRDTIIYFEECLVDICHRRDDVLLLRRLEHSRVPLPQSLLGAYVRQFDVHIVCFEC